MWTRKIEDIARTARMLDRDLTILVIDFIIVLIALAARRRCRNKLRVFWPFQSLPSQTHRRSLPVDEIVLIQLLEDTEHQRLIGPGPRRMRPDHIDRHST